MSERGVLVFLCEVCGRRTTSSEIDRKNAGAYDGGEHCGQKRIPCAWRGNDGSISIEPQMDWENFLRKS